MDSTKIHFSLVCDAEYMGRNGIGRCVGLSVYVHQDSGVVELRPINSRGNDGKCFIEIPLDAVPQLVKSLIRLGLA